MLRVLVAVFVGVLSGSGARAEEIESGPAIGTRVEEFLVKDCTGPAAGKTLCYKCRYGGRPVVAVFVRRLDDGTAVLIATLDALVARHREARLATFVVLLEDSVEVERGLREIVRTHAVRHVPLTIYRDRKPRVIEELGLKPMADTTVILWSETLVAGRWGFTGEVMKQERESLVRAINQLVNTLDEP